MSTDHDNLITELAITRYLQRHEGDRPQVQPAFNLSRITDKCGGHGICVSLYNVNGFLKTIHTVIAP